MNTPPLPEEDAEAHRIAHMFEDDTWRDHVFDFDEPEPAADPAQRSLHLSLVPPSS